MDIYTKTCSKCGETKPVNKFWRCNICKICRKEYDKERYQNNKDKNREYRQQNKDKIKEYSKRYYAQNKDKRKAYRRKNKDKIKAYSKAYDKWYIMQNKDTIKGYKKKYNKQYRLQNKDKIKAYNKEYSKRYYVQNKDKIEIRQQKNKDKISAHKKEYYQLNKDKINEYHKEHIKYRYKTDSKFRLNMNISRVIRKSLHGNKNGHRWELLVEFTLKDLMCHLEKQFAKGMTWSNYGKWHLDHRIPVSRFNFTKPEHIEFKKCWALENLQPMWAKDNYSKNDKLLYDFQGHLAI